MTRIKLSAAILCLLAVLAAWSCMWIGGRCSELEKGLDRTETLLLSGMTAEAEVEAGRLDGEWRDMRPLSSVLIRGCRLYDLDRGFAGLDARMTGDRREALAAVRELKRMTALLADGEMPRLRSVL